MIQTHKTYDMKTILLSIFFGFIFCFDLKGQDVKTHTNKLEKSTDIILPPAEESIELHTGSSIDNISAAIEIKAQEPSTGDAAVKLYHSNGSSGVLFSNNPANDQGFYLHSFGEPLNLSFNYGQEFFNPNISLNTLRLLNLQSDGRIQFGPGSSSGAFIDMTTPALSNFSDLLTIKKWNEAEPKWSLKSDRIEQNVNLYMTGDLDITDGQIVLKDEGQVLWDVSSAGGFNVRVNQRIIGSLTQSNGSNSFLGDVYLYESALNIFDETAHIDNNSWQIHLNNDNQGQDDANNWYIGASHNNWLIGDDKLVFAKGQNSGSDWIMYLDRNGTIMPNAKAKNTTNNIMVMNGSAYAKDFWVREPQITTLKKSTTQDFLNRLSELQVYKEEGSDAHIIRSSLLKSKIVSNPSIENGAYINYTQVIAIAIGALQELQQQVEHNNKLEERIARLESLLTDK